MYTYTRNAYFNTSTNSLTCFCISYFLETKVHGLHRGAEYCQNVADINTAKYEIYCLQSMINTCNLRHNNKYVKCADYTHIPHTTEITSYIG
jgi:hypothetical protein